VEDYEVRLNEAI
jgi:hypothetical protein